MRKGVTNQAYRFVWHPPTPYTDTPTLTVGFSSTFSGNFTQLRADATVTAVANDRRTLTLSGAVATALERDEVRAFLKTDRDTWYSVQVSRLGGTTAILSEPLPRELDLSSSATLNFASAYVDITDSSTGVSGLYPYTISYTDQSGVKRAESGLLKITPRPFDTGLDHDQLVARFPSLADMVPRRQSDFLPQIKASLDELILAIRDHVISDNVTEDEVFNQTSFISAHAYCTAALIYELSLQLDVATAMRERCEELLNVALRSVTLDLDGDGVVDAGEENLRRSGGSSTDFRASYSSYIKSQYDTNFTPKRAMRH